MKQLLGMKRIYIVASLLYFTVASIVAMLHVTEIQFTVYQVTYNNCVLIQIGSSAVAHESCWDIALQESREGNVRQRLELISVYAIIPLFLFWSLCWAIKNTYRWISAGFDEER